MFKQLDDHMLDDIGVDIRDLLRATIQEQHAIRRLWRTANGGFFGA